MSNESWYKQREEFNALVDLWDQALANGIFDASPGEAKPTSNFFGQSFVDDPGIQNGDTNHWNNVVSRSGEIFPDESMVLMEAAKKKAAENKKNKFHKNHKNHKNHTNKSNKTSKSDKEEGRPLNDLVKTSFEKDKKLTNGSKAQKLANEPNRIGPDTVGSDTSDKKGRVRVTAGLAAHPNFEKLEDLKKKLYDLETEMHDKNGLSDSKVRNLEKKFQAMHSQIEKLSNEFRGKYSDSEYYN